MTVFTTVFVANYCVDI